MDILAIPNNDHHTQDGTADLRVLNNKDNAVANLLIRAKKVDQPHILRILEQEGFDVVETDVLVLSVRQAANADNDQESNYIREFCDDILPRARWDLLPFRFLRSLYAGWLKIHHPGAQPLSTTKIARALKPLVGEYGWQFPPLNTQNKYSGIRSSTRMDKPEPMIVEFDCKDWMGPAGSLTRPKLKTHYAGLLRRQVA